MIGRLRGSIVDQESDGTLVVDVGGVGYEVVAPIGTPGRAEPDAEGRVALYVHTYVREEALTLYGFADLDERMAFRTLIGISKVGPKLALALLSCLAVGELAQMVDAGRPGRLTAVPGIGKKTAERIVLELKGKLRPRMGAKRAGRAEARADDAQAAQSPAEVLNEALVRMGFKQGEADRAVGSIDDLERPLGELVREALAILAP